MTKSEGGPPARRAPVVRDRTGPRQSRPATMRFDVVKSKSRDPLFAYLKRPSRRRLTRVVTAHYRDVWGLALRLTGNEDDASDIAQEVFLSLWLNRPDSGKVTSAGGFLSWRVIGRTSRLRRAVERRHRREEEHARRLATDVVGSGL